MWLVYFSYFRPFKPIPNTVAGRVSAWQSDCVVGNSIISPLARAIFLTVDRACRVYGIHAGVDSI